MKRVGIGLMEIGTSLQQGGAGLKQGLLRCRLAALVVVVLAFGLLSGCVRNTPGFCNQTADCATTNPNALCVLPAHQCVAATARGALSGSQQVTPTATDATGTFLLALSGDQTSFTYSLTHNVENPVVAHIHLGPLGQNGLIVFNLSPQSGATGTLLISSDQVMDLLGSNYYVDVHSQAFPQGEVRSQIWPEDPSLDPDPVTLTGVLSGWQETPPTGSVATGNVSVTLDPTTGSVSYNYQQNLSPQDPVIGVHIHQGQVNFEGDHIINMPTTSALTASGTLPASQVLPAHTADYVYLFKGDLSYFNIHTTQFTGGELRAQLLHDKSVPFNTPIDGDAVVPNPVNTAAAGNVAFFLSADHTQLAWLLTHTAAGATQAALFKGDAGQTSATPLCVLLQTNGQMAAQNHTQGYCPVGGANNIALADLTGGHLYVELDAAADGGTPAALLRGQVLVPPLP